MAVSWPKVGPARPAGGTLTVQLPTSLRLVKKTPTILQQGTGLQAGCPPGWYGITLDVGYQVLDENIVPIASINMEPQELFTGKTTYADIGGTQANYPQSAIFTRVAQHRGFKTE
jgi:hypothetical protein